MVCALGDVVHAETKHVRKSPPPGARVIADRELGSPKCRDPYQARILAGPAIAQVAADVDESVIGKHPFEDYRVAQKE